MLRCSTVQVIIDHSCVRVIPGGFGFGNQCRGILGAVVYSVLTKRRYTGLDRGDEDVHERVWKRTMLTRIAFVLSWTYLTSFQIRAVWSRQQVPPILHISWWFFQWELSVQRTHRWCDRSLYAAVPEHVGKAVFMAIAWDIPQRARDWLVCGVCMVCVVGCGYNH